MLLLFIQQKKCNMKFFIYSIFAMVMFCTSLELSAQDYRVGSIYEGYITKKDGSKVDGFIRYGTLEQNRGVCEFYTDKSNRKTRKKYKTKDIAGYKVGSEEYISVTYRSLLKQRLFAKVESKGQIMVLSVAEPSQDNPNQFAYVMALKKGDEDAIGTARFIRFAKQMSEYISDYEELSKKVKNKEKGYRLLSMMDIIEQYNKWYEENNG